MTEQKQSRLAVVAGNFDKQEFEVQNEEISFEKYLEEVYKNPALIRSAYQRLWDMIKSHGTSEFKKYRKTFVHYNFFDDLDCPIFGLEETLNELCQFIRGAAGGYGTEKRVLLLHGPVGSAKSTICRVIKKGLERYSETQEGKWYSFKWVDLPTGGDDGIYTSKEDACPMHEDPLKLIPQNIRNDMLVELNEIWVDQNKGDERIYSLKADGNLDPRCQLFMDKLLKKYKGDWHQVVHNHIVVVRKTYSESRRMGIATFQPKDEKNQDATELTGDINYAKLPHFGTDSDPRAFNFDGEFCVGNRGVIEFIEMLKLAQEFLYDLLGASQERQIKPKKFAQVDVDLVLIGHTNNPEYEKLKGNLSMEALRDRTVRVDVPYLLSWSEEQKVLEQDYNPQKIRQHIAPHTIQIAALWSILTRLENDNENKLSLVDKAKLYDGASLSGWTEDSVKEMRAKFPEEGMTTGISARYVQDKISNCLSSRTDYINPFMVLNELKEGLNHSSLISDAEDKAYFSTCVDLAQKELDEILKAEVQKALVGDEDAIKRLCSNYIDNLMAYINDVKVQNPFTNADQEPDERLMRSIEEKIEIPEQNADDFRREIAAFMGNLSHEEKTFHWDSNPLLKKALERKLFEDTKDHIKLSALHTTGASVVDEDLQAKIDAVKQRLVENYGYNQQSATDILDYVGSIFSRGDTAE